MAHLLVTGGAGYIGSHAVLALREAGHSVVVLDDLRAGHADLVGDTPLVRCDVGDAVALDQPLGRGLGLGPRLVGIVGVDAGLPQVSAGIGGDEAEEAQMLLAGVAGRPLRGPLW